MFAFSAKDCPKEDRQLPLQSRGEDKTAREGPEARIGRRRRYEANSNARKKSYDSLLVTELLNDQRKEILDLPLRALLLKLKKGEYKPRQVLEAYQVKNRL